MNFPSNYLLVLRCLSTSSSQSMTILLFHLPGQIKDLLNSYIVEASSGQYDYARALADFESRDESTLNFRKGDVVAVVPKHDAYTEKVNILSEWKLLARTMDKNVLFDFVF